MFDNDPVFHRNTSGRTADYVAIGVTDGGSRVVRLQDYQHRVERRNRTKKQMRQKSSNQDLGGNPDIEAVEQAKQEGTA